MSSLHNLESLELPLNLSESEFSHSEYAESSHGLGDLKINNETEFDSNTMIRHVVKPEFTGPGKVHCPRIYILTRTSNRKNFFHQNYMSIQQQNYPFITQLVSYDDQKSKDYVEAYTDLHFLNYSDDQEIHPHVLKAYEIDRHDVMKRTNNQQVNREEAIQPKNQNAKKKLNFKRGKNGQTLKNGLSTNLTTVKGFPYNLYLNTLMDEINNMEPGWIMFLDDDDLLLEHHSIMKLVVALKQTAAKPDQNFLMWQVQFPNNRLVPKHINRPPRMGDVSMIGFMFHSLWVPRLRFENRKGGDFLMVKNLMEFLTPIWIPEVLSGVNYDSVRRFGSGKRRDLAFSHAQIKEYKLFWENKMGKEKRKISLVKKPLVLDDENDSLDDIASNQNKTIKLKLKLKPKKLEDFDKSNMNENDVDELNENDVDELNENDVDELNENDVDELNADDIDKVETDKTKQFPQLSFKKKLNFNSNTVSKKKTVDNDGKMADNAEVKANDAEEKAASDSEKSSTEKLANDAEKSSTEKMVNDAEKLDNDAEKLEIDDEEDDDEMVIHPQLEKLLDFLSDESKLQLVDLEQLRSNMRTEIKIAVKTAVSECFSHMMESIRTNQQDEAIKRVNNPMAIRIQQAIEDENSISHPSKEAKRVTLTRDNVDTVHRTEVHKLLRKQLSDLHESDSDGDSNVELDEEQKLSKLLTKYAEQDLGGQDLGDVMRKGHNDNADVFASLLDQIYILKLGNGEKAKELQTRLMDFGFDQVKIIDFNRRKKDFWGNLWDVMKTANKKGQSKIGVFMDSVNLHRNFDQELLSHVEKINKRDWKIVAVSATQTLSTKSKLDWKFYLETYADLKKSGRIKDESSANKHWKSNGSKERRFNCRDLVHPDNLAGVSGVFVSQKFFKDISKMQKARDPRAFILRNYAAQAYTTTPLLGLSEVNRVVRMRNRHNLEFYLN